MKAGEVTFQVTNTSKDLVHETILVPAPAEGKTVPYDEQKGLIDEDAAGHLGEVSELEPGKSGALRLEPQALPVRADLQRARPLRVPV